jgi:hypothetical protein
VRRATLTGFSEAMRLDVDARPTRWCSTCSTSTRPLVLTSR